MPLVLLWNLFKNWSGKMETVMTRVQRVLQREFLPKEIFVKSAGRGKINGWIISKSFEDLNEKERQQKVWKLFNAHLNEKDRSCILGFFTFTPLEIKWIFDEDSDVFDGPAKRKSSPALKRATANRRSRSGARNKRSRPV
jgi:hypothetical protein